MRRNTGLNRAAGRVVSGMMVCGFMCTGEALVSGSAHAQVTVPTFTNGATYNSIDYPHAIAVTPSGEDLLGASIVQEPDGFAEIAVASLYEGVVRLYQNTTPSTGATVSLSTYQTYNVFSSLVFPSGTDLDLRRIHDIELVNLTGNASGEEDPDLLVSISYERTYDNGVETVTEYRGKVAVFRADRSLGILNYLFVNEIDLDFPATGVDVGDYSLDGVPDVLVTTDYQNDSVPPSPNPARITALQNNLRPGSLVAYGYLTDYGDFFASQSDNRPTYNVISGQFRQLVGGGLGGGTGNSLDFVSFGDDNGITAGFGNGVGSYSFDINILDGDPCGSSSDSYFGPGIVRGLPAAIVGFDPYSNRDASIATTLNTGYVSLIHYNSLNGVFYHRCASASVSNDIYNVQPVLSCGNPPSAGLSDTYAFVARGRLNNDSYDDIVHVDGFGQDLSFLLGRGSAPTGERIMQFDNCVSQGYFKLNYAAGATTVTGNHYDNVICADLNNDLYDDIVVSRTDSIWAPINDFRILVFTNTTGP